MTYFSRYVTGREILKWTPCINIYIVISYIYSNIGGVRKHYTYSILLLLNVVAARSTIKIYGWSLSWTPLVLESAILPAISNNEEGTASLLISRPNSSLKPKPNRGCVHVQGVGKAGVTVIAARFHMLGCSWNFKVKLFCLRHILLVTRIKLANGPDASLDKSC